MDISIAGIFIATGIVAVGLAVWGALEVKKRL